jgi:hypothetical protein
LKVRLHREKLAEVEVRKGDYAETGIREVRPQGYDVTNFSDDFRYFKLIDAFYLVNESWLPRPRD